MNRQQASYLIRFNTFPTRLLLLGLSAALLMAALLMVWLMRPPMSELASLVQTLTLTSLLSLGLGYIFYRRGINLSPSLNLTLVLAYIWAAVVTLFNVLVMARLMFVSEHDLALAVVLLLFAALIATMFCVFVTAGVTDGLRHVADRAGDLAEGDLQARAVVSGRDEVAQLAMAFNQMAEQLQLAATRRQEVERLRRDLVAWTSHDLRTPLTSIRAMIEALHDGLVDDPQTIQRYYQTIRADVLALNSLMDDLFELAQLDTGSIKLEKSLHSVNDLISDVLGSFQALAAKKQVQLVGEIGDDVGPTLMNMSKMSRVLSNLVSNALVYTPPGGQIELSGRNVPAGIQLSVQDSGPGFEPHDLPRIFEQFYRGEQARSRATGGAGLGLAIAKAIVEAHQGQIWAENRPAGGAEVSLLLPKNL